MLNEYCHNPLESIEDVLYAKDWNFDRLSEEQLYFKVAGDRGTYRLLFIWDEMTKSLQFCCELDIEVDADDIGNSYKLLSDVNSKLWLGHFDMVKENNSSSYTPCYRYTSLYFGGTPADSAAQMKELICYSLQEAERLYDLSSLMSEPAHIPEKMSLALAETAGRC